MRKTFTWYHDSSGNTETNDMCYEILCKIDSIDLPDACKLSLSEVLIDNCFVFYNHVGTYPKYKHSIKLTNYTPFKSKMYPVPYHLKEKVQEQIQDMVTNGIIEASSSSYQNPLVCVKKKNGNIRLCIDARKLNAVMIADNESPSNLEVVL